MRAPLALAAFVAPLALTLGGCATGQPLSAYQKDLDKLEADCTARGGILTPSGAATGRAQIDYLCKITGGATRIPQS